MVVSDAEHPLALRYGVEPSGCLGGHPVAVNRSLTGLADLLTVTSDGVRVDEGLRGLGSAHLTSVRRTGASVFDGPIMNMIDCDPDHITVGLGSYFDMIATCDSLRAEFENATGYYRRGGLAHTPIRDLADALAGDPLVSGQGRAAAVGVSVVVTVPTPLGRAALVGLRRSDLAADARRLHVVPSGMLEPSTKALPLLETARRELQEELGVSLSTSLLADRLVVLGIAHDLLRLRPEICLRLDLDGAESAARNTRASSAEYSQMDLVDLVTLETWLRSDAGRQLTPAGAGALALAAEC